jgi:predicted aspartyl protease
MGVTFVAVRVYRDRGPASVVRFLVDSGATYTVLPWRTWRRLGLRPRRTIELTLADGTVVRRRVSDCRFLFRGIDAPSPVVLGERNDAALLGIVTLENLGLVLNPFERTLTPMRLLLAAAG